MESPQGLRCSHRHWPYCCGLPLKPLTKECYFFLLRQGATSETPNLFINYSMSSWVTSKTPKPILILQQESTEGTGKICDLVRTNASLQLWTVEKVKNYKRSRKPPRGKREVAIIEYYPSPDHLKTVNDMLYRQELKILHNSFFPINWFSEYSGNHFESQMSTLKTKTLGLT